MRKILIVGAGHAGLQLALGLQGRGYDVTLITARTADEIRGGRILSTQCMFGTALGHERALGLDFWAGQAPQVGGIGVSVAGPEGQRVIDWLGKLDAPAESVDQRVKVAGWLEKFAERGGRVEVGEATTDELAKRAADYDLVLAASGRGGLGGLFERDPERSPYGAPQRALSVAYVHGLQPRPEHPDVHAVRCNLVPGAGELFVIPGLAPTGPCHMLFFEAVPGGPLDVFGDRPEPAEHLARTLDLMKSFVPWEYERAAAGVELTDAGSTLAGGFAPEVRKPVGELPGGTPVLGVADAVVANDPITGQGSNNASKCAASYLDSILEQGETAPFDAAWMQTAFDRYWNLAAPATKWSNAMLAPPPEHIFQLLGAAGELQPIADRFANAFDDPADLEEWFFTPETAGAFLERVAAAR
ncbi:FAD-binding oxidoreductase [Streptomyces sp. A7024]|uniref:FAD-binding oxidoreductase n=1 Tax=Streptomyces coryli TaxID=1128680 RepID=A0A6G4TTC1_9ACTN|nr:styrene monooxygenase/indole monooxygenase family protein [Streptomyces coryli]NGN63269.1 FAD-binding oxidoreductase [Streptomyces coryli]